MVGELFGLHELFDRYTLLPGNEIALLAAADDGQTPHRMLVGDAQESFGQIEHALAGDELADEQECRRTLGEGLPGAEQAGVPLPTCRSGCGQAQARTIASIAAAGKRPRQGPSGEIAAPVGVAQAINPAARPLDLCAECAKGGIGPAGLEIDARHVEPE